MGSIGIAGSIPLLNSCSSPKKDKKAELTLPVLLDQAPDGKPLKAGLIGCGGRGTGAAMDFLDAGPNLQIVALGDVFQDQLNNCREILKKERNVDIPDENCFIGFDSYEKVIDSGVVVVLLCTPPHFRPAHVEAAVNAQKHIFMEKPIAVDPFGVRKVLAAVKRAKTLNLNIISGTIRRSQKDYMETRRRVLSGEIGDITGANIIRNGGALWFRSRRPEWTDMEYMLRNWVNFCWLSGDHIVEQFIHEVDVMNWYMGKNPVKATGWGGRQRRVTGDQYDFFSVEYLYDNGVRTHCAARQIDGCTNGKVEQINCTNGYADAAGKFCSMGPISDEILAKQYEVFLTQYGKELLKTRRTFLLSGSVITIKPKKSLLHKVVTPRQRTKQFALLLRVIQFTTTLPFQEEQMNISIIIGHSRLLAVKITRYGSQCPNVP